MLSLQFPQSILLLNVIDISIHMKTNSSYKCMIHIVENVAKWSVFLMDALLFRGASGGGPTNVAVGIARLPGIICFCRQTELLEL